MVTHCWMYPSPIKPCETISVVKLSWRNNQSLTKLYSQYIWYTALCVITWSDYSPYVQRSYVSSWSSAAAAARAAFAQIQSDSGSVYSGAPLRRSLNCFWPQWLIILPNTLIIQLHVDHRNTSNTAFKLTLVLQTDMAVMFSFSWSRLEKKIRKR